MHPLEINKILSSFTVISDTREQNTDRAKKRYLSMGVPIERAKLDYCDYTYNFTLLDGKREYEVTKPIFPVCGIERKESLDELAQCFTRERKRFTKEFDKARLRGCRTYLIVENATWENLYNGKYRSKYHPNAFVASLDAWMVRYNTEVLFCKEETTGKLIKDILYRDLKERLERGEFG